MANQKHRGRQGAAISRVIIIAVLYKNVDSALSNLSGPSTTKITSCNIVYGVAF